MATMVKVAKRRQLEEAVSGGQCSKADVLTEAEAVGWTHLAHPVGRLAPSKGLPLPIWCLRHRRHKCLPVVRHLLVRRGDWQSCERRRPPRLASPRGINEGLDDPRASVRLLQVVNYLSHAEPLGAERPEHAERCSGGCAAVRAEPTVWTLTAPILAPWHVRPASELSWP